MADRFFLCCGSPKSGTTFLQRMLGTHPEVSCPSEQSFEAIVRNIETFVPNYNKVLGVFDRRTGGQGAPTVDMNIAGAILRDTILNLSRGFAGDKPVHGLNDNSVLPNLKFYDDLFESPPLISIFRDPVDRAISTWHHNHRLAKEEQDRATDHLKLLENPEGTLDGYVRLQAAGFNAMVRRFCDYAEGRSNILTIRYESLVEDRMDELRRLFSFLEVDASPAVAGTYREAKLTGEHGGAVCSSCILRPRRKREKPNHGQRRGPNSCLTGLFRRSGTPRI